MDRTVIQISAIICTYNGSKYVQRAIDSLINQSFPKEHYEIIVIDNCSTDGTKEFVESLLSKAGNLNYFYESNIGLSHARNRGIKEARGDIVAFLDDDAYACKDWLLSYVEAYKKITPRPVAVGGKILLDWEVPKPDWFPESMQRSLTYINYSQEPRFLDFSKYEYPFGANMSFYKEAIIELGGFNTNLGRVGKRLLSNEEKALFFKINGKGWKIYYLPDAYVYHTVPKERISKKFLFERQYWQGISDVVWYHTHSSKCDDRGKTILYLKNIINNLMELYLKNIDESKKVETGCRVRYYLGCLIQEMKFHIAKPIDTYVKKDKEKCLIVSGITNGNGDEVLEELNKNRVSITLLRFVDKKNKFKQYIQKYNYPRKYSKNILEKALEHFVSMEILNFKKNDVYIDIASLNSPFPEIVEEIYGCKTYRQDLAYAPGINNQIVGGDACNLPFPDNYFTKMTLHCSFEHFENEADINFIKEANRVLKRGGMVCILPLYLRKDYYILTDPNVNRAGLTFDPDAEIREVAGYNNRFGRMYNVEKFQERILNHCGDLIPIIYYLENEKEIDESCYLKFILLLVKRG